MIYYNTFNSELPAQLTSMSYTVHL
jgi:hypothetical protein